MPLKKRWDAKQKSIEETDITDDSTPANDEDDDDEEKEKNAIAEALDEKKIRGNKRSVKTVINSDKDSLSAKRRKKDNKEEACNSNVSSNTTKSIAEPKSVVISIKGETTNKISETDSDTPSAVGRRVKRPRRRLISDDFVTDAKNNRESNDKVNEPPRVEITVEEKPASRRKQRFPQKEMQNEIEIIEPSETNTATNESLVETNDTDEELLIPMPSKRKRERKKKYDVNIPESDATNTPAAKAKRELSIKPTTSSRRRSKIDQSQAVEEVSQETTKESLEVSQINETPIEQTEEFTTPSKPKGKRGRKKKVLTECTLSTSLLDDGKVESPQKTVEPLNVSQPCEISIEQTEEFTTPQPKGKRGRKKKILGDTSEISTPQSDEPKTPAAQSRPRHRTAENQFNVRLLLITKREQLDTDEVLTFESNPGSGPIQCGLCLKRTTESKWIIHLSQHYGVGWKIGEQEVEIDYRPSVLNAIITFLKDTELKGLACRMCNKLYRSGLGLLTHIENCGSEAQRADCEYCHRNYALSTLTAHVRSCPEKFKQMKETESSDTADIADTAPAEEQVLSATGRAKRHSTIQAETKIKQLGADLIQNAEEKHDFNPKDFIRYTAPLGDDVREKWSSDIKKFEKAFCPNKLCQFVSDKIEELEQHIASCRFIAKPGYYCTSCKRHRFETEKEAVTHVNATHHPKEDFSLSDSDCNIKTDDEQSSDDGDNDLSDAVEEDENELNDVETAKSSKRKRTSKAMPTGINFRKRVFEKRNRDGPNKMVLEKWLNFTSLNYSMKPLFENFKPQYAKCNMENLEKYLPNQKMSMKFVMSTKKKLPPAIGLPPDGDEEWQQIERFEKFHYESDAICFVGAPIISCSWIPLPNDVREQYLLVAYRRDMFKFTKFQNPKRFKTSLVLFKVTQNKMHGKRVPEMHVHYIIAIENGPVYNMAFLPSGGYNLEDNRLGLVAVATADSNINIYALPIEVSPKAENSNDLTVIELKPSFELMIDIMSQHGSSDDHVLLNPQCLQICWSEFNGHNHIFASYSNGCLGMWDISDDAEENLNRFEVNGIIQYAPINYFYVGEKGVRYFAVHYDSLGPRWLALNCFYRKFLIYDIRNFNLPIPLKEDYARNVVRGLEWCPLWEPVMVAYCDAIPNNGRSVLLINPTNIMSQQQKLDFVVSAVTGVHYNPWTNMCVESVDNGDIVFMDCREMHYELVLGRKFGERRILSSMDIKQLDGTPLKRLTDVKENEKLQMEWSMYDNDYKEKYGLVLQPLIKLKESLKSTYLSEKRRAPINVTPYLRINTLRCNLNKNAKKLVAVGYENGFIRIIHFDKDSQFRDW
uniref:TAZ zinc finger n=1 Tax=Musca domestica TaxID=7370 RepID=T1PKB7_MUSDO